MLKGRYTSGKGKSLKDIVENSLDSDKAENIVTIDIDENAAIADHIIVASGTSSRHIIAMAEKLRDRLNISGIKDVRIEGQAGGDWVVVDIGDIIVHLFRPEVRNFYNIEKMWGVFAGFEGKGDLVKA